MAVNGTSSLRSLPRICRTAVSRRTLAVEVLPLNVTAHVVSAPIFQTPVILNLEFRILNYRARISGASPGYRQQITPFRARKPLAGIAHDGSRHSRTLG